MGDLDLFNSYVDMTPSQPIPEKTITVFGIPQTAGGSAYTNAVAGSASGSAYSAAVDSIIVDPTPLNLSQPITDAANAVSSSVASLLPSTSTLFGGGLLIAVILLLVLLIIGKVEALGV